MACMRRCGVECQCARGYHALGKSRRWADGGTVRMRKIFRLLCAMLLYLLLDLDCVRVAMLGPRQFISFVSREHISDLLSLHKRALPYTPIFGRSHTSSSTPLATSHPHRLTVFLQLGDELIALLNYIVVLLVLVVWTVRLDDAVHAIHIARDPVCCNEVHKIPVTA